MQEHVPPEQVALGPQLLPHDPQCDRFVNGSTSHPLDQDESQLRKGATQPQEPAVQAPLGPQEVPHAPQLSRLAYESVSQPSMRLELQSR